MITVCVSEVFPEVYEADDHNIGIWIIGGVLLQMILEKSLTKGFEHGHFHHHHEEKKYSAYCFDGRNVCSCVLEGIPLANITDVTLLIYWELCSIIYQFHLFSEHFY